MDDTMDVESENSGEESSDNENEDEETGNIDQELKDRLKDALGDAKADSDEENDNVSIDMDDLDDEAMEKMDAQLSQIFKQLSGKKSQGQLKKEKKDAIAQMHFKIRSLDIIDVYLSHQPTMSHVLFLLIPLLKCLEATIKIKGQEPLTSRLKNTLKKITNIKKIHDVDNELEPSSLAKMLQSLIDFANSGSPLVAELSQPQPIYAQCCTMILRFSQRIKDDDLEKNILDIYKNGIDSFFNKT